MKDNVTCYAVRVSNLIKLLVLWRVSKTKMLNRIATRRITQDSATEALCLPYLEHACPPLESWHLWSMPVRIWKAWWKSSRSMALMSVISPLLFYFSLDADYFWISCFSAGFIELAFARWDDGPNGCNWWVARYKKPLVGATMYLMTLMLNNSWTKCFVSRHGNANRDQRAYVSPVAWGTGFGCRAWLAFSASIQ